MLTILEPIGADLIVALINRYIINNDKLCQPICADEPEEPEIVEDDSSPATTSVNGAELHVHDLHPFMHT